MKFKKLVASVGVFGLLGIMGCSSSQKVEDNLLRCNDTSNGRMAEVENGFFYAYNGILYYADKTDLSTWVAVCNKPDCMHNSSICNGYVLSFNRVIQKDNKLYNCAPAGEGLNIGVDTKIPFIYEIATDGSGTKKVYDIPMGDGNFVSGGSQAAFQDRIIFNGNYLDEKGMEQEEVVRIEEDEQGEVVIDQLYQGTEEVTLLSGNSFWSIGGDDVIINSFQMEKGENMDRCLWRVDGETWEELNIPDDINLQGGYLHGNYFQYFQEKEGFFEIDLTTGERTLLHENWFDNSRGYILTEEYMLECNLDMNYDYDTPLLKFYNGSGWYNVTAPEEVKMPETPFYVASVASDRIFMRQNKLEPYNERSYLYYFMLNDDTPELIYCGEVTKYGEEVDTEEPSSESNDIGEIKFEEIVVFDNEDYLFKITGAEVDYKNRYILNTYWENKSGHDYFFMYSYASINGLQCNLDSVIMITNGKKWKDNNENKIIFDMDDYPSFKIQDIYSPSEYTDIELRFLVVDRNEDTTVEKSIRFYPYGEEAAIKYVREPQETDQILVDNEYATIILTGYKDGIVPNGDINFYFINKTDKLALFKVEEARLNGKNMTPDVGQTVYSIQVNGNSSAFHTLSLEDMSDFIYREDIMNVEELELLFRVFETDFGKGELGEDFVNKTVVLKP